MKGIERFTSGDSNSWVAFSNSQRVNTGWEDPEFTADDSSLFWDEEYGNVGADYMPPAGLHWIRPKDMKGYNARFE